MTTQPEDQASRVKKILTEQLDVELTELSDDKHLVNDLGADSLGVIEIVLALEEEFEIDIPDEDIEKSSGKIGDIVEYVQRHVPAEEAGNPE